MSWIERLREYNKRKTAGFVKLIEGGFEVHRPSAQPRSMFWDKIRRIEVERCPAVVVEVFRGLMTDEDGRCLEVDDCMGGLNDFEAAVFEHFPESHSSWVHVFTGPPEKGARATAWVYKSY